MFFKMAHGGARSGSGRKPDAATRMNEAARKQVAESGLTPLDYMLATLRVRLKPNDWLVGQIRSFGASGGPMDRFQAAWPLILIKIIHVAELMEAKVTRVVSPAGSGSWARCHARPLRWLTVSALR